MTATRVGRPWIGPAFMLSLVSAAVWLGGQMRRPPADFVRPTVGEARTSAAPVSAVGLTPEPAWLLRHADVVGLTARQRASLARLSAAFNAAAAPQRAALEQAGADLEAALRSQQQFGRLDQDSMRAQAAGFGEQSADLAALRQAAWHSAWAELTEPQRQVVRELRRRRPLALR